VFPFALEANVVRPEDGMREVEVQDKLLELLHSGQMQRDLKRAERSAAPLRRELAESGKINWELARKPMDF